MRWGYRNDDRRFSSDGHNFQSMAYHAMWQCENWRPGQYGVFRLSRVCVSGEKDIGHCLYSQAAVRLVFQTRYDLTLDPK